MSLHRGRGIAAQRCCDLYLPADVDMPCAQDSVRNSKRVRLGTHEMCIVNLQSMVGQYLLLSGTHEERLPKAIGLLLMREKLGTMRVGVTIVGASRGGNHGV